MTPDFQCLFILRRSLIGFRVVLSILGFLGYFLTPPFSIIPPFPLNSRFLPSADDHDTSDSAYQQRRPLSVSVAPRSATPGPRSTSAIRGPPATFSSAVGRTSSRPPPTSSSHSISILGPCGTTKTTNKVPTVVKLEEPEVPNKDPKKIPDTEAFSSGVVILCSP